MEDYSMNSYITILITILGRYLLPWKLFGDQLINNLFRLMKPQGKSPKDWTRGSSAEKGKIPKRQHNLVSNPRPQDLEARSRVTHNLGNEVEASTLAGACYIHLLHQKILLGTNARLQRQFDF